jgi:SAM-dependent methyltransferase
MSGFTAEWLALREAADGRARDAALADSLRAHLAPDAAVLDLGAGTGANARHLAPRLGGTHPWTLVDHDDALLAALPAAMPPGLAWQAVRSDLANLGRLPLPVRGLVTASALLDLVSQDWLDALAACCAEAAAAALFVLTYDGRIAFDPALPDDARIRDLVNRHQRTDKGFGPALGPAAPAAAHAAFAACGYRCRLAPSDWVLGPTDAALQAALLEGWADAAIDISPRDAGRIADWHESRQALVMQTRLTVGHADLLAVPQEAANSQS